MTEFASATDVAANLLIVDDDDRLRDLLRRYLTDNGFLVATASNAAHARTKLTSLDFDLIVLDLMMPGESGLDFAQSIKTTRDIPILMLTAMAEPEDRIKGLEHGADDYLIKPFEPRELVLRIQNILKRASATQAPKGAIRFGTLSFDLDREELSDGDGELIALTGLEASFLSLMARRPGDVFSRDDLAAVSERAEASAAGRAVDVQVTRLRRKIEPNPREPRFLQTVRGKGYVLKPE